MWQCRLYSCVVFTEGCERCAPYYLAGICQDLSQTTSGGVLVSQKCEKFENDFVYSQAFRDAHPELGNILGPPGLPSGIKTRDDSGNLIAEARLLGAAPKSDKQQDGILIIEEFHYKHDERGNCLIFKAKSFIDGDGRKVREIEATGKKSKDYFFIWPISS